MIKFIVYQAVKLLFLFAFKYARDQDYLTPFERRFYRRLRR